MLGGINPSLAVHLTKESPGILGMLMSVKKLLASGGRFVTCMTSVNVSSILKKSDPKKIQIKIMKHDFPELLVIATRL
ncbi:unnamed protein product [Allacma fusca]|uniref:Uncharacterized protein n=1 Tax=Allacma fusca TaxID=39272 RepID=A0A8J2JJ64_9HEXA|nr:unnamed protein product [Allacma fusca]